MGRIGVHVVRSDVREAARLVDAIVHRPVESDNGEPLIYGRPEGDGGMMHDYTVRVIDAVPGRSPNDGQTTLRVLRF